MNFIYFCLMQKFLTSHLKPRRVAATTVAQRVAIEMDVQLGQEVYQI